MTALSAHFTVEEMRCPGTGELKFQPGFLEALEELRVAAGFPFKINSGCRTLAYNRALERKGAPASPNSFHLIGNPKYGTDCCAIDIARRSGDGPLHARLMRVGFDRGWSFGLAKSFIHMDLRTRFTALPQTVYLY